MTSAIPSLVLEHVSLTTAMGSTVFYYHASRMRVPLSVAALVTPHSPLAFEVRSVGACCLMSGLSSGIWEFLLGGCHRVFVESRDAQGIRCMLLRCTRLTYARIV